MGVLTTGQRQALPDSDFAVPQRRAYPIDTRARARNALARVAQHGSNVDKHLVRTAVQDRYPGIEVSGLPQRRRNPGPFGLDISTIFVIGIGIFAVMKLKDLGKGNAPPEGTVPVPGNAYFRYERADWYSQVRRGADQRVTPYFSHRGPGGEVKAGVTFAPHNLGCPFGMHNPAGVDWYTTILVGDDADWTTYSTDLLGAMDMEQGPKDMYIYIMFGGKLVADHWECNAVTVWF